MSPKIYLLFALFSLFLIKLSNGQAQLTGHLLSVARNFNCNRLRGGGGGALGSNDFREICKSLLSRIGPSFRLAQSLDCGQIYKIPGDPRTSAPWTAAIYIRDKNSIDNSTFYINGVIVGESTILSIAGGAFGALPRGARGRYFIHPPENFLVGVGLTSTDLKDRDSNSQLSEVAQVVPNWGHEYYNTYFHYVLYHLKTPLNLNTPYARAICLPFLIQHLKPSTGGLRYFQTGFARSSASKHGKYQLTIANGTGDSEEECASVYRYNYKSNKNAHYFCGKISHTNTKDKNICFLHGSVNTLAITNRWFLTGLAALIPYKNRQRCDKDTTYFYSRILQHLDWIFAGYKCGPHKFACDEKDCIDLKNVCNGRRDCKSNNLDEDITFCKANDKCSRKGLFQCYLQGKCISRDLICDGKNDCPSGHDENVRECKIGETGIGPRLIQKRPINLIGPLSSNKKSECTSPLDGKDNLELIGIDLRCDSGENCFDKQQFQIGEEIRFRCKEFFVSKYTYSTLKMICNNESNWEESLPFGCDIVCGFDPKPSSKGIKYPWAAELVKINDIAPICHLTIIESKFLLTSATCLQNIPEFGEDDFQILIQNTPHSIKQIWISASLNQRGLGMLELTTPLDFGTIRPACYLDAKSHKPYLIGQISSNKDFHIELKPNEIYCDEGVICTTKTDDDAKSLSGDGLMLKDKYEKYHLEGVFVKESESFEFTTLESHRDWIIDILEAYS